MLLNKIYFILFVGLLFSCSSSSKLSLHENATTYIFDLDSRITQGMLARQYTSTADAKGIATARNIFSITTAVVHAATSHEHSFEKYPIKFGGTPRQFLKILTITNVCNRSLHLDLVTKSMINDFDNASIRNIILPANKTVELVVLPVAKYLAEFRDHKTAAGASQTKLIDTEAISDLIFTKNYQLKKLTHQLRVDNNLDW